MSSIVKKKKKMKKVHKNIFSQLIFSINKYVPLEVAGIAKIKPNHDLRSWV